MNNREEIILCSKSDENEINLLSKAWRKSSWSAWMGSPRPLLVFEDDWSVSLSFLFGPILQSYDSFNKFLNRHLIFQIGFSWNTFSVIDSAIRQSIQIHRNWRTQTKVNPRGGTTAMPQNTVDKFIFRTLKHNLCIFIIFVLLLAYFEF